MLVGVMSDSHDNIAMVRRALEVFRREGVEAVIHLGDIVSPPTLRVLAGEAGVPVYAVYGNNCGERLGLARVAEKAGAWLREPPASLELGGRRLLLIHGFGSPENTVELVDALAESRRWDAVLYGHTHKARVDYRRGVLILNPGETAGILEEPSVAILDLDLLRARIVDLGAGP